MVYCLYFLFTILYCYFVFQVCNLHCLSMHGDKSQSERSRVLESFLAGECPVLVCTALLGRGIDLPNVSQVSFQMIKFGHIMALNVLLIACLGSLFFSPEDSLILNMVWMLHTTEAWNSLGRMGQCDANELFPNAEQKCTFCIYGLSHFV